MTRCALVALLFAICACAAPSFTGSRVCAGCHPVQANTQALSAHASALFPARGHPLAPLFPGGPALRRGRAYQFEFVPSPDGPAFRIDDGANLMTVPAEWAFGAGRQAVTFVSRIDSKWYVEHYASYYPALHTFAPTPGQDAAHPHSIAEAAGVLYKIDDAQAGIAACFECHSTGPVSFDASGAVRLTESGVHCEACHGAGSGHAQNPERNRLRNPVAVSAADLNRFCGACHRPPAPAGIAIDWNYAWNVRHQPMYFSQSRCFLKSAGALSCLTCHDPHEAGGNKRAAFYNGKCAACHSAALHPPARICVARTPADCVDCHMPRVSPQTALRFTNHWIGVYRGGAMLKPER